MVAKSATATAEGTLELVPPGVAWEVKAAAAGASSLHSSYLSL